MPRPKRPQPLYTLTVRIDAECARALRMEAAGRRTPTTQGRLLEELIRAHYQVAALPAACPDPTPRLPRREEPPLRPSTPEELDALKARMDRAHISYAAIGREFKITGDAVREWFGRGRNIPQARRSELEALISRLEAQSTASRPKRP